MNSRAFIAPTLIVFLILLVGSVHGADSWTLSTRTVTMDGAAIKVNVSVLNLATNHAYRGISPFDAAGLDAGKYQITVDELAGKSSFLKWLDGNTTNPRVINLQSDLTLTALYQISQTTTPPPINPDKQYAIAGFFIIAAVAIVPVIIVLKRRNV